MLQVLAGVLVGTAIMLIALFPLRPRNAVGWLSLIVIAAPAVLALEFVGDLVLNNRWLNGVSKTIRILIAVTSIALLSLLLVAAWQFVAPFMEEW